MFRIESAGKVARLSLDTTSTTFKVGDSIFIAGHGNHTIVHIEDN